MKKSEPKKIVIVGGVAAGATAAARLRRLDEDADITIVERGPYVSFANCGLPYHISGAIEKRSKLLLQTPEGFFSRYRVKVLVNAEAVGIDRQRRTVSLRDLKPAASADAGGNASGKGSGNASDGVSGRVPAELNYDALLLAQGGTPIVPPLPGADLPHVFKLWTIPDMDAIQRFIKEKNPASVAVVGGGFIGLETAEAFLERGLKLTIVELSDHLMPPMDTLYGSRIKERFEKAGAAVILRRGVKAIEPNRVLLDDGSYADADLVLLSVGVRPNTDLAKASGLELGATGALKVDEYMRTSDPSIWAAGDMVEVVSKISGSAVRIPLAGPANRQGRIAATNIIVGLDEPGAAGGEAGVARLRYSGAAGTSVVKIFDETAASTGFSLAAARKAGFDAAEVTIQKGTHASYYPGAHDLLLTLVYDRKDGRLLGAQAYGTDGVDKRIDAAAVAVQARLSVDDLAELDFAYSPPYSSANDPLNMAAFVAMNARSGYSPLVSADSIAVQGSVSATLIDLRSYGEYAKGHALNALHLPLDELRDRLDEVPRSLPVRLISDGGFEGHIASRILRQSGFQDVANISGGWAALRLVDGLSIEQ